MQKQPIPFITEEQFLATVHEVQPELAQELKPYLKRNSFKKRKIEAISPLEVWVNIDGIDPIHKLGYSMGQVIQKALTASFEGTYTFDELLKNQQVIYANKKEKKEKMLKNLDLEEAKIIITASLDNALNMNIKLLDFEIDNRAKIKMVSNNISAETKPQMFQSVTVENFGSEIDEDGIRFSIKYRLEEQDGGNVWADLGYIELDDKKIKITYTQTKTNDNHLFNTEQSFKKSEDKKNTLTI